MATEVSLYGGEVLLTFDEEAHSYMANGEPCPSVTQILKVIDKPALPRWAAKEVTDYIARQLKPGEALDEIQIANLCKEAKAAPWKKASDAADIGSIVHRFAELYALGERPPLPINAQAKAAAEQFLQWWESNHVEVIAAERKVYSRQHNYAGTVDLVAWVNDKLTVADFKTSTGIWPEYRLQLSAYAEALEEEDGAIGGCIVDQRLCLRFGKDGAFESAAYSGVQDQYDWRGFLSALELHRWQESIKQPRKGRRAA